MMCFSQQEPHRTVVWRPEDRASRPKARQLIQKLAPECLVRGASATYAGRADVGSEIKQPVVEEEPCTLSLFLYEYCDYGQYYYQDSLTSSGGNLRKNKLGNMASAGWLATVL